MSIETIRELETLASVCPELNMANHTEDDVRHLNDWAIEMSLLVERYALSQQPDNAACKSVQKRLAAQQPATAIACGIPGMAKTTCPYCEQGFAFEHEQPATGEPVVVQHRKPIEGLTGETIGYTAWMDGKGLDGWPHRELYDHPAPSAPADVVRDAERYRFIRDADVSDDLIPDIALYAMESLDEYIDAAMLSAK